jgi:EmrB/QacA subfamily drug resistance transporter
LYPDNDKRILHHVNAIRAINSRRTVSAGAVLFVVCLAQFMVILDVSIVNVALPAMRRGLHFSTTGLQWVVNAYTLTFAGFLMLGGRSADLLGRKRVFLSGVGLFALSSLICTLASSRGMLIGARTLQGFAGAVVSPATLSIITSSFREGAERNRGLAAWGAIGGLGASSGALLGGFLTQGLGWPAIFAVNVPLGAIVIVAGLQVIPDDPAHDGERHFDVTGAVLVTAGLVSLTYGIVRTDTLGWGATGVLVPIAAAVVLLAAFVYVEARVAVAPLVPLSIFRLPRLRAANMIVILLYAAQFPSWFFLTLYMQQVLGYDAIQAGLGFLPMTLTIFATSTLAPKVVARFGPRRVIAAGMLTAAAGMTYLTGLAPGGNYFGTVAPGAVLAALGMGLTLVPSTIVATQGVAAAQSGLASGLLNTSRLVGGALGLAVLSTVAAGSVHGGESVATGLSDGFGIAFTLATLFSLAGVAIALFGLRRSAPAPAANVAHESRQSPRTRELPVTGGGQPATTGQPAFAVEERAA